MKNTDVDPGSEDGTGGRLACCGQVAYIRGVPAPHAEDCDFFAHEKALNLLAEDVFQKAEDVLNAFCDSYRENKPFNQQTLFAALCELGYGLRKRDPKHDQGMACARPGCGHPYERHFDSFDGDREVGCKYCGHSDCEAFVEPKTEVLP
jgi:hypothetical protein